MTALVVEGGELITPFEQRFTRLWINQGQITAIGDTWADCSCRVEKVDATGCYVTPGLFDLQVNGNRSCNFWADPEINDLCLLRQDLLSCGVTSFLPTLITDELAHLKKNLAFLETAGAGTMSVVLIKPKEPQQKILLSRMPGIHLEGPFISPERPGVHPVQFIQEPSVTITNQILTKSVLLMTMACERDPEGMVLKALINQGVKVSLGHSNATLEESRIAFDRGVNQVTHTFNALPALHHRAPGAIGAALLDDRVSCCVIPDGLHVNQEVIKLMYKLKGWERMLLVTDSAHIGTTGGELVGSSITLDQGVRNMVNWGICDFAEAIKMSSFNPAHAVGLQEKTGQLLPGLLADVVLWDKKTLSIRAVIIDGQLRL